MKPKSKIKRIALKIFISIAMLLIVLRIAIPVAVVMVANKTLPGLLNTDVSIGFVNMLLLRGRVSTGDITIKQPEGFEGDNLFSLGKVAVDLDMSSLKNGPIIIESIIIDDLELNIICNTNGSMNLKSLANTSTTNTPATNNETSASSPTAVVINKFEIRNLSLTYHNKTYEPPLLNQIKNLNMTVTNIIFDPSQSSRKELVTGLQLSALSKQSEMHDAFVGIVARIGVLGTNVPAVNTMVRFTGIELNRLNMVFPHGVSQALGGSCVDLYVDLSMNSDFLDCKAKIKTADNIMRLAIGGTPSNPIVDKSTALGNVVTRPSAILGGLIGDTGGAGIKVVTGAGKTTAAVGGGALKVVGGLGKGLFRTAKGLATADMKHIKGGLYDTTVGTASKTKDAVVNTASAASSSVGDVASTAVGKSGSDAWRDGSEERWNKLWIEAKQKVNSAPYPHPKNTTNSDKASLVDQVKTDHTEEASTKRKSKKKFQRYH